MKKVIHTSNAPKAIGPYSQACRAGGFVFISGQIPLDPRTGEMVNASIELAAEQVLNNIEAILKEAGLSWEHVVKADVFLVNLKRDFEAFNAIYAKRFNGIEPPARQVVEVSGLPKEALIEMACIC